MKENNEGINVLSLFDGMSCGLIALERAGIKVNNYYASEIDLHAIKVSKANYPNIVQLGDVTQVDVSKLPKIDLLIGGSPCQGFSMAGKMLNFEDERSKLFFQYVRVLNDIKKTNPDIKFLLENVKMKKEYSDVISENLGVQPVAINSRLVSALNRPRLYWSNFMWSTRKYAHEFDECPCCKEPFCTQHNEHFSDCSCIGVHEEDSIVEQGDDAYRLPDDTELYLKDVLEEPRHDLPWLSNAAIERLNVINKRAKEKGLGYKDCILYPNDKYLNLDANFFKGPDGKRGVINQDGRLRMPTPLECERLQTVPEGYTSCVSNSQRYKMLGNGWTIDVIVHILQGLKQSTFEDEEIHLIEYDGAEVN